LAAYGESGLVIYTQATPTDPEDLTVPVLFRMDVDDARAAEPVFEARLTAGTAPAAGMVESPPPVVHGDSVTIALAPFDSLWTVSLLPPFGTRSLPIESEALAGSQEPVGLEAGRSAFFDWLYAARFPGRFGRTPRGAWVVRLWGVNRDGSPGPNGLVHIDATGRRLWEVEGRWSLLAVSADSGAMVLWDRDGLDPAVMVIAQDGIGAVSTP
jgi:hypothetical protein